MKEEGKQMPNFEDQTVRFAPGSSPYKPANNSPGTKLLIFDGDKAPAEYDLRSFGKNIITFAKIVATSFAENKTGVLADAG